MNLFAHSYLHTRYATEHNFEIYNGLEDCGYLQFADGTYQETVGRVHIYWTFASGERIPITFEVLQNCCSNLIIGEDVLWDYDVFNVYAASITQSQSSEPFSLAPFGWESKRETGWLKKAYDKITSKSKLPLYSLSKYELNYNRKKRTSTRPPKANSTD